MRRDTATLLLGLLAVAACATSRFDQHFEAQRYAAAVRVFETDPELQHEERALFRAAVAYAVPGSPVHDPARARETLERLLTLHPEGSHRGEASRMLALLRQAERLERRLAQRAAEAEARRTELGALRSQLERLELQLRRETEQADLLREVVRRLETDLRLAEDQLRALREELTRLKEIDLEPSAPRPGADTVPDTLQPPPAEAEPPDSDTAPDSSRAG